MLLWFVFGVFHRLDENKRVQQSLTEKIAELNKDKTADIEAKALVQQNRQLLSALAANNNNKVKKHTKSLKNTKLIIYYFFL